MNEAIVFRFLMESDGGENTFIRLAAIASLRLPKFVSHRANLSVAGS